MVGQDVPGFSRRDAIRTGVLGGLGAALSRSALAAAAEGGKPFPLITKAIPSTGEKLPVIGIGTNAFSLAQFDTLRSVLKRFSELGAMVIDTAAMWSLGMPMLERRQ